MTASRRDDDLFRLLAEMPREAAPAIPVEKLLRRLTMRRRRIAALLFAGVATALTGLFLMQEGAEPPENLRLRIVNIGDPIEQPPRDPPELNLP